MDEPYLTPSRPLSVSYSWRGFASFLATGFVLVPRAVNGSRADVHLEAFSILETCSQLLSFPLHPASFEEITFAVGVRLSLSSPGRHGARVSRQLLAGVENTDKEIRGLGEGFKEQNVQDISERHAKLSCCLLGTRKFCGRVWRLHT